MTRNTRSKSKATKAAVRNDLDEVESGVSQLQPADFVGNREDIASKCLQVLKVLYDFSKKEEKKAQFLNPLATADPLVQNSKKRKQKQKLSRTEAPLDNLITEDFESEQIWQEIQLQNNFVYENLVSSVSRLLVHQKYVKSVEKKSHKLTPSSDKKNDTLISEREQLDDHDDNDDDDESELDDLENELESESRDLVSPTVLLGHGPSNETPESPSDLEDKDEVEDDLDQLGSSKNKSASNKSSKLSSLEDVELSNFEKKKKKIEENIEKIEEEALQPKSWQYQGEVTAKTRPENSLLEEHLIFDHLIRQAPEVTAETTLRLEDVIKQRIKDQAWDDVERKIKPVDDPSEYKKKLVLDAEKSKMSLAEIYEKEYIKQKKADEGEEEKDVTPDEHLRIQKDLNSLFAKLDSLSNFHYTPKAPSSEIKVVSNLPSIAMEEVAPVSVSDATLLAPREIESQIKGAIKSKSERTDTDMKRERRVKKKKQKLKRLAQEEKAKLKGLGLRNIKLADNMTSKAKKLKDKRSGKDKESGNANESFDNSKELKSSKAFFAKLQNQVHSQIKNIAGKRKKEDATKLTAKQFKL